MDRAIAVCWLVFKLVVLPAAIVLSVALPNQSFIELFQDLTYVIHGALGDSSYTGWLAATLAAPVAVTSWLIPSALYHCVLFLAAIFGNFGFWVLMMLLCASISAPEFLGIQDSGFRMIPFRKAVIALLIVSGLGVVYNATRINFFDDTYKGHLVINGRVTDVPATVVFAPGGLGKKPTLMVSVKGDKEALGFQGSYSYFINNNPNGVRCNIDDYSAWPDGRYYIDMRSGSLPSCKQAVMTPHGFDGMTLEVNRGRPGAFAVELDRQFRQNPIIIAIQYWQYLKGGYAEI